MRDEVDEQANLTFHVSKMAEKRGNIPLASLFAFGPSSVRPRTKRKARGGLPFMEHWNYEMLTFSRIRREEMANRDLS